MNEFMLVGEIEEENTAKAIAFLAENEGDVVLNIDSVGGDVFAGLRLCQAIGNHNGKVTAKCGVVVASIASIIAMSCDEIVATKDTFFMVHPAWAVAQGTADELMSTATLLEQASNRIKEIIAGKAINAEAVEEWMKKDTWFGYEALLENFKDITIEDVVAKIDDTLVSAYAKLTNKPEALVALVAKLQDKCEEDKPEDECEKPKDGVEEEEPQEEPEAPKDEEEESEEDKKEAEAKAKAEAYIMNVLEKADSILKL